MAASVQVIRSAADLEKITFEDGVAALEVSVRLLRRIRFKNHHRGSSPRLSRVMRSIEEKGFQPIDPIIARIGRRGRWVVVDGGHRLTALLRLTGGMLSRLLGRDRGYVYVLLFETELSRSKM